MNEQDFDRDSQALDIMTLDEGIEKPKDSLKTAKRFFKELLKQKFKIILILFSVIVSAICTVITPILIGDAIDQIYNGVKATASTGVAFQVNIDTMGKFFLSIIILYLLSTIFSYIQQYTMATISQDFTLNMRKSISEKLNRVPLKYYDTHKKGDVLSRVTGDLERISNTLQEGFTQAISSVVTIVGALIIMSMISPLLTLIALGIIVASLIVTAFISSKTHNRYAENQTSLGNLNAQIEEAFTGNSVIKAFNLQEESINENHELSKRLKQASSKSQFSTFIINPIIRFIGQLGYVVIATCGAFMVISGAISLGAIQAIF